MKILKTVAFGSKIALKKEDYEKKSIRFKYIKKSF